MNKLKLEMYDKIVKQVMENPFNYEWEIQGFGMLRTYIDKDTRLQIWLKDFIVPDVTDIHTHPWDFESLIYQGQITNYIFKEHGYHEPHFDSWYEYDRCLILTGEHAYVKEKTKVLLDGYSTYNFNKGDTYCHGKNIPHRIDFIDGTITILTKLNIHEDSLAYSYVPNGGEWVSAAPRIATKEEIITFIDAASKLNKEEIPTLEDFFNQYTDIMGIFMVDEEAGEKELHRLIDSFNLRYKIVPRRSTK